MLFEESKGLLCREVDSFLSCIVSDVTLEAYSSSIAIVKNYPSRTIKHSFPKQQQEQHQGQNQQLITSGPEAMIFFDERVGSTGWEPGFQR